MADREKRMPDWKMRADAEKADFTDGVAKGCVTALHQGARKGNIIATIHLLELSRDICERLASLAADSGLHAQLRSLACLYPTFPVLVGRNSLNKGREKNLLESLHVGESVPFSNPYRKRPGRRVSFSKNIVNQWARLILNHILFYHQFLALGGKLDKPWPAWLTAAMPIPPLNESTAKDWLEIAWALIMEETGQHPEDIDWLREIGEKRGRKAKGTPASKNKAIRRGLKETLGEAIERLARIAG